MDKCSWTLLASTYFGSKNSLVNPRRDFDGPSIGSTVRGTIIEFSLLKTNRSSPPSPEISRRSRFLRQTGFASIATRKVEVRHLNVRRFTNELDPRDKSEG